ncbi:hypothetical protein GCM10009802_58940 [Streptomyces synnematoformans]|uniref:Tetrapyrrole methylase domain-containing protein n=1 Tax=Streptomyces synnematoformans TaxID=415721 RepID=A0ABP4KGM4_9ACTN
MITVIGCGTGAPPARIEEAELVVGAARHLAEAELPRNAERVTLGPLAPALERIAAYVEGPTPAPAPRAEPNSGTEPRGGPGTGAESEPCEGSRTRAQAESGTEPRVESRAGLGPQPRGSTQAQPRAGAGAGPQEGSGAQPSAGSEAEPHAAGGTQPRGGLGAQPREASRAQPHAGSGAQPRGGLGGGAPEVREGAGTGHTPPPRTRVAVLASGDPGFFGIVRALATRFGPHRLDVRPAAPAVAVAFARAGLPWDDAAVVSAHGRDLRTAVNVCRAHPKTAVLTGPGAGPAELGAALAASGVPRTLVVASALGSADEDVVRLYPADAAARDWSPGTVNVVLCLDERPARSTGHSPARSAGRSPTRVLSPAPRTLAGPGPYPPAHHGDTGWALPEADFDHRAGLVTKYEVRALALARLAPRLGDLVWDVGAGSGSVAVECARFGAAVVAVERDAAGVARVRANAAAHGVDVQAVHGTAPATLAGLPDPDAVFVGGGGGDVAEVVAACAARARRAVVVTLAAVDRVPGVRAALADAGFGVDGVLLQSSRLAPLPGEVTRLAATNPVFVLWGLRAAAAEPADTRTPAGGRYDDADTGVRAPGVAGGTPLSRAPGDPPPSPPRGSAPNPHGAAPRTPGAARSRPPAPAPSRNSGTQPRAPHGAAPRPPGPLRPEPPHPDSRGSPRP